MSSKDFGQLQPKAKRGFHLTYSARIKRESALYIAKKNGHKQIVNLLKEYGAKRW
jgi:ankyrin repeat protein